MPKIPQYSSDMRYEIYFASSSHTSKVQNIYMHISIFLLNSLQYFREKYKKYLRFFPDFKISWYHREEKIYLFLLFDFRIDTFDFVKEKYKPGKILDFCIFLDSESLVILIMFEQTMEGTFRADF